MLVRWYIHAMPCPAPLALTFTGLLMWPWWVLALFVSLYGAARYRRHLARVRDQESTEIPEEVAD